MKDICILVPCFNEEKRLNQNSFLDFSKNNPHIDFLFINDGSSDNTQEVLNHLSHITPQLKNLWLKQNCGKAEAVRKGMLSLVESDYNLIGYWDADLATPLNEIERFLTIFKENNQLKLVAGCRHKRLGVRIERNIYRHYLGRIFAMVASLMLALPVYDTQCGAKVLKKELIPQLFDKPFVSKWFFDVELFFRIKNNYPNTKSLIYEIPLNYWVDIKGSKVTLLDFFKVPLELFKINSHYKNR